MPLLLILITLASPALTKPALAQPATPPPAEDCGCGVPASPRGPR